MKRVIDILLSLLAIIVLSPFLVIISIAILIDDPKGSPFYIQHRCGLNGRMFKFYKFRSMYDGSDKKLDELLEKNEMVGPVFKIKDDPRITRIGKFIRKTSLDELPQFVNVLKGDMSIVGPRPPLPREVDCYNDFQRQRLFIKPGLTCYWQTTPNRNALCFDDWVNLDIRYIKERSLYVDFLLMIKTVAVMASKQGE